MSSGWSLPSLVAICREALALYYLVRGQLKRFRAVLVYCLYGICSSLTETLSYAASGLRPGTYARVYWVNDLVEHAIVILLVIALIRTALENHPQRKLAGSLLLVAALTFAVGSVVVFQGPNLTRWMTPVSRNLSFCEEGLNLILWAILIQRRDDDHQLLLVSAGIGIQVTGEVIGHTLRLYTALQSSLWIPNLLVTASAVLWLLIWIW